MSNLTRFFLLLVVIVDIDDFHLIDFSKNENRAVFLINPETPKFHFSGFKHFGIKA